MLPADAPFLSYLQKQRVVIMSSWGLCNRSLGGTTPLPSLTEPASPVPSDSFWLWPSSSRAQTKPPELPVEPENKVLKEKTVMKESSARLLFSSRLLSSALVAQIRDKRNCPIAKR